MSETRRDVLHALETGPVSGPTLARELDLSRAAVWNHVEALRDAGFEIVSSEDGYLVTDYPAYGGLAVECGLEAPFTVEYHDQLESTNQRGRELARAGETDVAVLAGTQTDGRGRLDRAWDSPPGGIWMSLVIRPDVPPARIGLLTLAGAVAVTRAAREAGVDARIKWPNDVLVPTASSESTGESATVPARGGQKLAGILTELGGEADQTAWVVLGMGVNARNDPESLPSGSTSLMAHTDSLDRRLFVQRVLELFDHIRAQPDEIPEAYRAHSDTLGRRVRIDTPDEPVVGTALDVTETGALRLDTDTDVRTIHAGDCEHLRPD